MDDKDTKNTEEKETSRKDTGKEKPPKKEVIWSQLRVPNSKKGSNPYYPFIMMGTVVLIVILSFVFAKLTS